MPAGPPDQANTGEPRAGVSAALRFLAQARRDRELAERLAGVEPEAGLQAVVSIAREAGFEFTAEELRAAHAHDWGLRRALYLRSDLVAESAASTAAVVNKPSSST